MGAFDWFAELFVDPPPESDFLGKLEEYLKKYAKTKNEYDSLSVKLQRATIKNKKLINAHLAGLKSRMTDQGLMIMAIGQEIKKNKYKIPPEIYQKYPFINGLLN